MGANPNIFQNKENRRVVPPGDENFFVTAEEFQAIDTAFGAKADQTEVDSIEGRVTTLETDLGTLETQVDAIDGNLTIAEGNISTLIGNVSALETGKQDNLGFTPENTANKATDFTVVNDTLYPTVQAVDVEIDTEINAQVATTNANQFNVTGGVASIQSILDRFTAFTVSFASSGEHGSETDPVYHFLSVDRTNGRDKNQRIVYHCAILTPAVLVDPLVESWGTKPSWLFVTGDSYLTGVDNLNQLTFTFHKFYDDGSTIHKNAVVCNVLAITNGNEDASPPDLDTLILINFNQFESPVQSDSVQNLSFYGSALVPEVLNPSLGIQFDDLGSENYALRRTASDNNIPNRAHVRIPINPQTAELFRTTQFTIVGRVRLPAEGTDADIGIFGNQNAAGEIGWGVQKRSAANSNRLRLRVGTGAGAASIFTASSGEWLRGANYYAFAIKFRFTEGSPHTREHKMWLKSSQAGLPLTLIDDVSTTSSFLLNAFSGLDISLDSFLAAPSSTRNNSQDYLRWSRAFDDDAPILAELNLIDP